MRKNIMKRLLNIFVMFALAMLFLSCPDEGPDGLQIQEQHGKATVSFSVTDARTVLPHVSLADAASYQLLGRIGDAAETVLVHSFTGTGTSASLVPGTWNFTLNAYNNAGGHILQGTVAHKQINLTGTNQVTFSLSPVKDGTGSLRITLNFPESAYVSQIKTSGDIDSETFPPADSGSFVYTKNEIAAGDYFINFELYCRDELRTVVSELVLVRSNLSSIRTITLAGENLKPIPEVVIDLAPMNEWELTEQTAIATPNADKVFTVTGNYTSYQWYLDGTEVGTSSAYTFNKPVGVYQLIVVATNGDGESRSGCCRVTVARSLSANVWVGGSIADANGEDWYSFPVTSGTTYYIWWNDREGDGTKTADVAVSARYENETTFIFGGTNTAVGSGWTTPQSFTANQTGTVYLRAIPYNRSASNSGTYGIMYNTSGIKTSIHTVTFNINDGIGITPVTRTVYAGSDIILPSGNGLSRSGHVFGGWNTSASGTGMNYDAGATYTPAGSITLYARWHVSYIITFHANGEYGTPPAALKVLAGSDITLPDRGGLSSGYTFGGWNINASGTGTNYTSGSAYTPTGNVTLYARWNSIVAYNVNGGTGTPPPAQTVNKDSSITLPSGSGLSKNIESYGGWNTTVSGFGTNYSSGSAYTPTGDITLYARWIPPSLTNTLWHGGNLPSGVDEHRYSFSATAGTRYYIWWDDSQEGSFLTLNPKTLDITVTIEWSGGSSNTFDSGWEEPFVFTPNTSGMVYVIVRPRVSGSTGTYGVAYSTLGIGNIGIRPVL